MTEQLQRPDFATDEMLDYLDDLRDSGTVNMYGATPYLADEFDLTKREAREVLFYWMRSFPSAGRHLAETMTERESNA